jgi:cyclopropane fatty-acyl-phospholipid synthase-like methyltransferase
MSADARHTSPAALRNRGPILDVLRDILPPSGTVLEVASGSGEHAIHFARALPDLTWQPSDPSAQARASIEAWIAAERPGNMLAPLDLDAAAQAWPIRRADAVIAINMVHISPWAATLGLLRHANRLLPQGGPLLLYGPYLQADSMTPSNAAFDADLRARNPQWGVRSVEEVERAAATAGFRMARVVFARQDNATA